MAEDDHELALRLHRQWNLPSRRNRAAQGAAQQTQAQQAKAALKDLVRKRKQQEASSSSEEEEEGSPAGSKRRKGSGGGRARADSSGESGGPQASQQRQQQRGAGGGPARQQQPQRKRPGRRPQHLVAAEQAKARAAKQAGTTAGDGGGTHVKCFFAGLRFGAWLPVVALQSRGTLAAALTAAFHDDGVATTADDVHVVLLTSDGSALEFPPLRKLKGAASDGAADAWEAAAKKAVRVYAREGH
eukprot:scaffold17.g464.t1